MAVWIASPPGTWCQAAAAWGGAHTWCQPTGVVLRAHNGDGRVWYSRVRTHTTRVQSYSYAIDAVGASESCHLTITKIITSVD